MLTDKLTVLVVPVVLWGLVALSVVTWALFIIKLVEFGRDRAQDRRFRTAFWAADTFAEGEVMADSSVGPMADIARAGFAVVTGSDIRPGNRPLAHRIDRGERLERALRQIIDQKRRSMESWLSVLASFGSTAPFIGLFGTVWAVMEALINIDATGSSGLAAVAGPVGHALIATGMGIAVAVPAVLIYNFLLRRLKVNIQLLNDFAFQFYSLFQQSDFRTDTTPRQPQPYKQLTDNTAAQLHKRGSHHA